MRLGGFASVFLCIALGLVGCYRAEELSHKIPSSVESLHIPLIQATVIPISLPQNKICEQMGCTQYAFQTIKTHIAWIDDYFLQRVQQIEPTAFEKYEGPELDQDSLSLIALNQTGADVRYLGQNAAFASFVLHSYSHNSGAEKALYHAEYVNLDLNEQKRLGLKDILQHGQEQAMLDALYAHNKNWLLSRNIAPEQLALSDNFYYDPQGLVLVYPLYSMGEYRDGMPELVLPYQSLSRLIKNQYLPALTQKVAFQTAVNIGE